MEDGRKDKIQVVRVFAVISCWNFKKKKPNQI